MLQIYPGNVWSSSYKLNIITNKSIGASFLIHFTRYVMWNIKSKFYWDCVSTEEHSIYSYHQNIYIGCILFSTSFVKKKSIYALKKLFLEKISETRCSLPVHTVKITEMAIYMSSVSVWPMKYAYQVWVLYLVKIIYKASLMFKFQLGEKANRQYAKDQSICSIRKKIHLTLNRCLCNAKHKRWTRHFY